MLDVCDLLLQAFVLESVSVHLRLIVLQLSHHVLQLLGSLLQVLLVDLKLLGNLWAALFRKDVLKFNVQLLLLLDEYILLADLFSLGNQALLQRLNLLNEFVGLGVRALKLPPTMHIQGLLKLISEELSLLLLLKQLFLELEDLSAEVRDARCLVLSDNQLPLDVGDLLLGADDLSDLLLVVDFPLVQSGLLDLDLLIENLKLLVTLDQLSTQDVTLIDDHLVVFLLLLLLLFSLGDDEFETIYVTFLGFDHVVTGSDLLLNLLNVSIEGGVLILVLLLLRFLSSNSGIFGLDLLLELRDLLSHSLELHLELCDLLGGLEKVL